MPTASGVALVTGASSGIGREYARRLAARGDDVIAIGRRSDRLEALAAEFPGRVRPMTADLATDAGIAAVAAAAADDPLTLLVNNAGLAHYMPFTALTAEQAAELVRVKVLAATLIARSAVPGMAARGHGAVVTVAGMLAFSGPAPKAQVPLARTVYTATLAYALAFTQALDAELTGTGVRAQVLCPGVVATEFHERQGMDLSAVPRMSAADVVTASLRGFELGEVVTAPGVERTDLLDAVSAADLAAFGAQSPQLAARYRD